MAKPEQVFISYKREDAGIANAVRLALRTQGLDVWWDESLQTGERWEERIDQALLNALAVVVIWSSRSVVSDWVRHEASIAKIRGVLTHAIVDDVQIPPPFRAIQTVDLRIWSQREDDPRFQNLVRSIRHIAKQRTRLRRRQALIRLTTVLVMLVSGAALGWTWGKSSVVTLPPAPTRSAIAISVPSPSDVRKTLADANQEEIANLRDLIREYSFITSMQRWRGNRNDPQSVLSEVKTRLSKPILIPKDDAAQMLKDAQSEYDTWKLMPVHNEESGYNGVRSILAPVLSRISLTTYEQRIFSHSPDLYGPVILSEMYSSTPEEQYYLMINLLAKSQRARWALPFLEAHITANGAGPGSKDFREATGAALQILTQDEYNAWYQQMLAVTGSPSTSR